MNASSEKDNLPDTPEAFLLSMKTDKIIDPRECCSWIKNLISNYVKNAIKFEQNKRSSPSSQALSVFVKKKSRSNV